MVCVASIVFLQLKSMAKRKTIPKVQYFQSDEHQSTQIPDTKTHDAGLQQQQQQQQQQRQQQQQQKKQQKQQQLDKLSGQQQRKQIQEDKPSQRSHDDHQDKQQHPAHEVYGSTANKRSVGDMAQEGQVQLDEQISLTEQQLAKWRGIFDMLADVSEYITKCDLETYWQKQNKNPTEDDLRAVIAAVHITDTNGDGKISFEEFVKVQEAAEQQHFYTAEVTNDLMDALKTYDTDGNNVISRDELRAILSGYDDGELDELMADADLNGDGKLSIQELAKLMTTEI